MTNFDEIFEGLQCLTSTNWLDFGDDPNHITLGLGLGIEVAWQRLPCYSYSSCCYSYILRVTELIAIAVTDFFFNESTADLHCHRIKRVYCFVFVALQET